MKSILYIGLLYICLSFLMVSCTESDPAPACIKAEVVGADCDTGWYILKLEKEMPNQSGSYVGQLQSGYVTTNNLPESYRQPGSRINVSLEIIGDYGPRCVTVTVMYPAVSIKQVCGNNTPGSHKD